MTPSLRETIGNKVYELATTLGLSKEQSKYMMQTAQDAADVVPGVGAAVGVDDTKRALDKGDYGDALVNGITTALGEIPGGGDVAAGVTKAIFGGIGAKLHRPWATDVKTKGETIEFQKAQDLEDTARSDRQHDFIDDEEFEQEQEKIWKETGWFRGKDGDWRFEIPDEQSFVMNNVLQRQDVLSGSVGVPLSNVIKHKELFQAYPDLNDITVYIDPTLPHDEGYYAYIDDNIHLSSETVDNKNVLLHEIQHAVQEREGFARGSNPSSSVVKPGHPSWEIFQKNKSEILTPLTEEQWNNTTIEEFRRKGYENAEQLFGYSYNEYLGNFYDEIERNEDKLIEKAKEAAAWTHYRLSAGENEAKAVQRRMDYTPNQRGFERPPWEDEPYPRESQIVSKHPPKKTKNPLGQQTDKAMSKSDDDKGKVIPFKKKKDNLLEQSKKLRLELNKGDKYKTAVQEQKYSKERAKHIKEISEPYKDKTDEELVDIYVKMSRRAGSQFHVDNAKEHAQTLADKGKFDREATLEAINAVKNRLKKP